GAVPVEKVSSVVGKTAAVDLTDGQVVTSDSITGQPVPGAGQAVVGLQVTPGQMPGGRLAAGDSVRVVRVPNGDDTGATEDADVTLASAARVLEISGTNTAGENARVVTVVASDGEADGLARASA